MHIFNLNARHAVSCNLPRCVGCVTVLSLSLSFRCRTLFYLHNVRAIVQLILIVVNIFEVAESYLATGITINESISISPLQLPYAWMSFITTVGVIAFTRICEVFDKSGERALNVKDKSFVCSISSPFRAVTFQIINTH